MTKRPSEKNKAWEKERRDRLNKSFEELAKLLPQYDPTITWSKHEIIQKSIAYIAELQKKHESLLEEHDPKALSDYTDLLDTVKFFRSRNSQLASLLQKASITIPPIKFPKFLTENPNFGKEHDLEITTRPVGRPKKYASKLNATKEDCNKAEKTANSNIEQAESKGNEDKRVTDIKVTENEIAPVSTTVTTTSTPATTVALSTTAIPTNAIISTGVLLPLIPCNQTPLLPITSPAVIPPLTSIPAPKCKVLSVQTLPRLGRVIPALDKDGKVKILPRPVLKVFVRRTDNKVPIPALKRNIVKVKRKRRRRKQQPKADKTEKTCTKRKSDDARNSPIVEKLAKPPGSVAKNEDQQLVASNSPDDYFSTLQIPDGNSTSVSPTAAFLLSFPVVSGSGGTVGGKNADEMEDCADGQQQKDSPSDGLENLNNFFDTKEYHKYCGPGTDDTVLNIKEDVNNATATDTIPNKETATEQIIDGSLESSKGQVQSVGSQEEPNPLQFPPENSWSHNALNLPPATAGNSLLPLVSASYSPACISSSFSNSTVSHLTSTTLCVSQPTLNSWPATTCSAHPLQPTVQPSNFSVSNIFTTSTATISTTGVSYPISTQKTSAAPVETLKVGVSGDSAVKMNPAPTPSQNKTDNFFGSILPASNRLPQYSLLPNTKPDLHSSTNKLSTTRINTIPNPIPIALPQTTSFTASNFYQQAVKTSQPDCNHGTYYPPKGLYSNASNTPLYNAAPANLAFSNAMPSVASTKLDSQPPPAKTQPGGALQLPATLLTTATTSSHKHSLKPIASTSANLTSTTSSSLHLGTLDSQSKPFYPAVTTHVSSNLSYLPGIATSAASIPTIPSTTTSFYFPLSTPIGNTTTFTFNLTPTTTAVTTTMTATSLAPTFLSYSNVNQNMQWIPSSSTISDYKSTFTFSLTSSNSTYSTSQSQTTNSQTDQTRTFPNIPAIKSNLEPSLNHHQSIDKNFNPFPDGPLSSVSHSSTGFTFSLAKPKSTITNTMASQSSAKLPPNVPAADLKHPPSYPSYNFDNYSTTFPKDTTNFTFALTKPTQSFSSTFSIDATLGNPHPPQTMELPKPQSSKSNYYANNQAVNKTAPSASYFDQNLARTSKSHVNWMTSSDVSVPVATQQTMHYYPSQIPPSIDFNAKNNLPIHSSTEDHLPSWSPSKILDTSHLMQSAPGQNYYGSDLNPPSAGSAYESSAKLCGKVQEKAKTCKSTTNTTQGSFFSVSQLVDQNASNSNKTPSEQYSKKSSQKSKDCRKNQSIASNQNAYQESKITTLNNYSAEALISKKDKHRNYPPALHATFPNTDYYPSHNDLMNNVYMPQDNDNLNYNANYFYNYMPPNQNFMQDMDYLGSYGGTDSQYGKMNSSSFSHHHHSAAKTSAATSNVLKSEKRHSTNGPGVNLVTSYDAIPPPPPPHHPILDTYEAHHYPHNNNFQAGGGVSGSWNTSKSSLPGSGSSSTYHHHHHGQVGVLPFSEDLNLPNCNSQAIGGGAGGGGTSNLTNFNLSSICPEINDKVGHSNW